MKSLVGRSTTERVIDLICDTRLPHTVPRSLWRTWKYKDIDITRELPEPLHVCVTFDVEGDFRNFSNTGSTERFLPRFQHWAAEHGITSTLYVQGDLLPKLSEEFHTYTQEHELGLHGLHHEVWGRSRWGQYRLGYESISREEKEARLVESLRRFSQAGLARPVSFRAPYLNTNQETIDLLEKYGFNTDSSAASYFGVAPIPVRYKQLWEIPVTVHPVPQINLRKLHSSYLELSMGSLLRFPHQKLIEVVRGALAMQERAGWLLPPFIVILGHPWEFENTPGVSHGDESNFKRLHLISEVLSAHFDIKYSTVSDLISAEMTTTTAMERFKGSENA